MFELIQLEQLLAIDKYGTLSKASEKLNISQPALSRSIQRLEEDLNVALFTRTKNKISFNENGKLALEYARKILSDSFEMKKQLRSFDKSQHTINIGSCAPAPIWSLTPEVSKLFNDDITVNSEIKPFNELVDGLKNNIYQIIITTGEINIPNIVTKKYCTENLYISLPPTHHLAKHETLSLSDLNGESILILSKIGFWYDVCKEKMPDSLFLEQTEINVLDELRRTSTLPSFATNLTNNMRHDHDNRILIPLTDPEVNVTFYLHYNSSYKSKFQAIKYEE